MSPLGYQNKRENKLTAISAIQEVGQLDRF